jgi:SSS family solute:Na+ symporter
MVVPLVTGWYNRDRAADVRHTVLLLDPGRVHRNGDHRHHGGLSGYEETRLPALVFGVGAFGFYALPFSVVALPVAYLVFARLWSVSHVHGFVTPAEFVRARFGSRTLALLVAVTGIVATMPYIALQLLGLDAVLKVVGLAGPWPLTAAFTVLALFTFRSGLRAPALISIAKDALLLWTVLAAIVVVATFSGVWHNVFRDAAARFAATPSKADGLLLVPTGQLGFVSLIVARRSGSACTRTC